MNDNDVQAVFVPKFYEMDPEHDTLLSEGTDLRNGMIALIADPMIRGDEERTDDRWEHARLRVANRWCEVTDVKVTHALDASHVTFIAVYPDGVKVKRRYHIDYPWLVRTFSLEVQS